jgi:hypothetical protein
MMVGVGRGLSVVLAEGETARLRGGLKGARAEMFRLLVLLLVMLLLLVAGKRVVLVLLRTSMVSRACVYQITPHKGRRKSIITILVFDHGPACTYIVAKKHYNGKLKA